MRNFLLYQHISDFLLSSSLHRTTVQLLCKVIGDWPLRAAGRFGICTTHTCSERLLVGEKAKQPIFARKRESCFPKAEHTWNWNVRRTKAALRHWKRENWNTFQNIWKKSNTPQGSVFLEWTIHSSLHILFFSTLVGKSLIYKLLWFIHARIVREYSTIRCAGRELFDSHKMSIRFTPTQNQWQLVWLNAANFGSTWISVWMCFLFIWTSSISTENSMCLCCSFLLLVLYCRNETCTPGP